MARIISLHSFRRGTGKTVITANIASILAVEGKRVGVIDTGFRSPSAHIVFGLPEDEIKNVLNDYVWGKCDIEQAAYDITDRLDLPARGKLFLVPASTRSGEVAKIAREGYDVNLLNDGFLALNDTLKLDVLFVDTHAGITEETLLSIAIADIMGVLLRIDRQDHQGTAVIVDLARKLNVPLLKLIVNEVPGVYDADNIRTQMEKIYKSDVMAIFPHTEELTAHSSTHEGIFSMKFPDHRLSVQFRQLAKDLT